MSIGNLKTQGDKGNNWTWQNSVVQLLQDIVNGIAVLPGVDYETRTSMYQAIAAGPGYSIGDIIIRYDVISVPGGIIVSTLWFNQTTQLAIAAPAPADIVAIAGSSSVTVINGPLGAAVNIQDGGNSITIDNANLNAPLSTLNKEATQLLIKTNTDNLDVLLSTRATEATLATRATEATLATMLTLAGFQARINTLGQKLMAASTPVVIASDQSALPVTLPTGVQVITSIVAVAAGSVAAGASSVSALFSSNFTGTFNGISRAKGSFVTLSGDLNKTLPAIAYTVTAGSITIDSIT
jgi:hypothetical protein